MARQTSTVVIGASGRDHGKHFLITEMSAQRVETWATKLLLALGRSGVDILDDGEGLAGVARLGPGVILKLPYADAAPLLAEMMTCVSYIPDPSRPMVFRSPPWEDDIEELSTLVQLRLEVYKVHLSFLPAANPSTSGQAATTTH